MVPFWFGPEKIGDGCPHPHGMGASIPTYNKAYDKDGKQFLQQGTMSFLRYTRPKPYECLLPATPYLYFVHSSYLCVLCFCSLNIGSVLLSRASSERGKPHHRLWFSMLFFNVSVCLYNYISNKYVVQGYMYHHILWHSYRSVATSILNRTWLTSSSPGW